MEHKVPPLRFASVGMTRLMRRIGLDTALDEVRLFHRGTVAPSRKVYTNCWIS